MGDKKETKTEALQIAAKLAPQSYYSTFRKNAIILFAIKADEVECPARGTELSMFDFKMKP